MYLPRSGKILLERSFDSAMDKIEDKFEEIDIKLDEIKKQLEELENAIKTNKS